MDDKQIKELILQSLEHEKGGVLVYRTALKCARNKDLREEWERYHSETQEHVRILTEACEALGLNAEEQTPGRSIVRDLGGSLVAAMEKALAAGNPSAAEIVACECVVIAETKDHLDWQLIGEIAKNGRKELMEAYEEVEDQEDEHLYHTKGWCRELWLKALGLPAVLPPPEEEKKVKTAIGQARAESERKTH